MAMTDCTAHSTQFSRPAARGFSIVKMIDVWRSRRALAQLDSTRLDDIGLSVKRAAAEEAKPIWDVPATWRD
ncbi:DUF1127 domain-containing protein [uncultured Tateyamaria sp.]|uniref:DUF1127 domain-containing protein n=1 Tax=uncultured Tateyamaria sp. TaxID=455651 RepID=UPI002605C0EF|nr:DUF1127 domain-containing protein [uncultured Tateyamaria sp.]